MGLLVLGVLGAGLGGGLELVAPAYNPSPAGAPPLMPFLFITIACGACSGFHSLVSSGTSAKQISSAPHALFVGYGSMLLEAVLATVVIVAVAAGIGMAYETPEGLLTGTAAWQHHYASWEASQGLGSKIGAVVTGAANMMGAVGVPTAFGTAIVGVFIASFAGTTLDSATRIQRYVITELFRDLRVPALTNRYVATAMAVLTAAGLAFATGASGKGALTLWPMFGAVNQLLAALALLVITLYLRRTTRGLSLLVGAIPCVLMLVVTLWAVSLNEVVFLAEKKYLLAAINGAVLALSVWMTAEGVGTLFRPPEREQASAEPQP
jgi:carbon starvation protein